MELKIAFWNIHNEDCNSIANYLVDLLLSFDLELLFLSEHKSIESSFEKYLPNNYTILKNAGICQKVMAIAKKDCDFLVSSEERRFLVVTSKSLKYTVVGLHLPSDYSDKKACLERSQILRNILEASNNFKSNKEIFVGDYNCMPYADELLDIFGMHSVLFKNEMESNVLASHKKHYNPMLLELNENNNVYGSFRYTSGVCNLYWYAYDQVIVSSDLVNSIFDIQYLKSINGKSLMSPTGVEPLVSDHLPLVFKIKE